MTGRTNVCGRPDCLADRAHGAVWCQKHLEHPTDPEQPRTLQTYAYRFVCFQCSRGQTLLLSRDAAKSQAVRRCGHCGARLMLELDLGAA